MKRGASEGAGRRRRRRRVLGTEPANTFAAAEGGRVPFYDRSAWGVALAGVEAEGYEGRAETSRERGSRAPSARARVKRGATLERPARIPHRKSRRWQDVVKSDRAAGTLDLDFATTTKTCWEEHRPVGFSK